ncbi:MAG: hypothetical protein ACXV5F_02645 [Halobacteriota archaeon]
MIAIFEKLLSCNVAGIPSFDYYLVVQANRGLVLRFVYLEDFR